MANSPPRLIALLATILSSVTLYSPRVAAQQYTIHQIINRSGTPIKARFSDVSLGQGTLTGGNILNLGNAEFVIQGTLLSFRNKKQAPNPRGCKVDRSKYPYAVSIRYGNNLQKWGYYYGRSKGELKVEIEHDQGVSFVIISRVIDRRTGIKNGVLFASDQACANI